MKFNCGPSPEARRLQRYHDELAEQRRLEEWHPFFAIKPRRVDENDCRCFEWIERRGKRVKKPVFIPYMPMPSFAWVYTWEYRARQETK